MAGLTVVTGATGQLGRMVVEALLAQVPAAQLAVSVRKPERAKSFQAAGVRVVGASFAEPHTLAQAFEGAEQVLLVSGTTLGEEGVRQHEAAMHAAVQAGAKRILYTSHQAASLHSAVAFARDHAATEELLARCGVPWVALRNGFYTQSALYQLGAIKAGGALHLPEDGPVSWTARADLAKAAAAALLDPGLFDGVTPPLTATERLTFDDLASLCTAILGRPVTRLVVPDEQYRQGAEAHGFPPGMVELLLGMFRAMRAGEFDKTDPTLGRVLGAAPTPASEVLRAWLAQGDSGHEGSGRESSGQESSAQASQGH